MTTSLPDNRGYFGPFGGRFVPETLMHALEQLDVAYREIKTDGVFQKTLANLHEHFIGRPTPLYRASQLARKLGGAKIYLKREDLAHTGAHKINNAVGQALLAKYMGKNRIIAETGAGQHGVATAAACALLGLECTIYMGTEDVKRQRMNALRMDLLGAKLVPVETGSRTLKDAINEAIRDWVTNVEKTHYIIGSVVGPHPYPMIVRDFQAIIGQETRDQILQREGKLPDLLIACVGGGSNAMGLFYPFLADRNVHMVGVEAGGDGIEGHKHAATLIRGRIGVLHGAKSYLLQDDDGQVLDTHSVSAGLDYPGVGPEHSWLKENGRAEYAYATDAEALDALRTLSRTEGIIPALETAHALAHAGKVAPKMHHDQAIVVCLSGRGDKDLEILEGLR